MHEPPCWPRISTHATLWYGLAAIPQAVEVTVAVTLLTPPTCTTWGAEIENPHGDGGQGSACAVFAPTMPPSARADAADRDMTSRIMSPMVDRRCSRCDEISFIAH